MRYADSDALKRKFKQETARTTVQVFPWKLFRRFITQQLLLVLVMLMGAGLSARTLFRHWFVRQASLQAREALLSLSHDFEGVELPAWCAAHSGGLFTFSLLRSEDLSTVCSTIQTDAPAAREPALAEDVTLARARGFGAVVEVDAVIGVPTLFASLAVPGRRTLLRAALPLTQLKEALLFFDRSLAAVLLALTAAFAGLSLWISRRLVFPLGRLLLKARRVLTDADSPVVAAEVEDDELSEEEADEWDDLESMLDHIRTDLQKKTETLTREREELATLMSAISDAILAVDTEGNPLFFNSRFALLFGSRDLQRTRPRLGEIFRAPEVLEAFHGAFREGLARETNARLHVGGLDSLPRFFSLSVSPLRKESGEVYGAVGIFHDVTELKRAEQIRIEFVANVSHELRTPLTSIKGYADTLIQDISEPTASKMLGKVARNVDRLMSLIDDLLDLSSIEGGAEILKLPVDTRELTQRVLAQLENKRAAKGHWIEASYAATSLVGDPNRIEQVLVNLLDNALKYVPHGGKITLTWETGAKGTLLRVADSGPGISPDHQARLFERFYRVDKARSRELGGTGLGLAIVKHILVSHGGTVYVTSEPGKGAEFVCQFPAASQQSLLQSSSVLSSGGPAAEPPRD